MQVQDFYRSVSFFRICVILCSLDARFQYLPTYLFNQTKRLYIIYLSKAPVLRMQRNECFKGKIAFC